MKETVPFDRGVAHIGLPAEAAQAFAALAGQVKARSLIVWGEHCSECAYPRCYSTCAFYAPRGDLHCRRFEDGIEPVADRPGLTRIRFRKWGKLEGRGPAALRTAAAAAGAERRDALVSGALDFAPAFAATRNLAWRWNERKQKAAERSSSLAAEAFVIETFAPDGAVHPFTVSFLAGEGGAMFQAAFTAAPGYGRLVIPSAKIAAQVPLDSPFMVQIEPVGEAQGREVVFGLCDFAAFTGEVPASVDPLGRAPAAGAPLTAKVVVWDLDETLWTGTLAETGADGVVPRPEAVAAVKALDERGVLQSIASKNDHAEAIAALERFGLADYFLHPQVSWSPKSGAVARIAKALDLGLDSFVFIDDQPFERAEVQAAHPSVRALAHTAVDHLTDHPWFDVPVTPESRKRRSLYRAEVQRGVAYEDAGDDYLAFLRGCGIVLDAAPIAAADAERVYELSQRTNQLNFTGRKFGRDEVEALMAEAPDRASLTLRCTDKFGDYGLIGFAVIDLAEGELTDFFMSCRVQRKRVEHAFFALAAERLKARGHKVFKVRFRRTERNKAAYDMLADLGFDYEETAAGNGAWERTLAAPFADADVVRRRKPQTAKAA